MFYRRVQCFSEQAKEDFVIYLMSKIAFIWIVLFCKSMEENVHIHHMKECCWGRMVLHFGLCFFVCKVMILWRGKLTKHASIGIHIHMRLIGNSCQRCRQGLKIKTCTLHEDKIMRKYFEAFFGEGRLLVATVKVLVVIVKFFFHKQSWKSSNKIWSCLICTKRRTGGMKYFYWCCITGI